MTVSLEYRALPPSWRLGGLRRLLSCALLSSVCLCASAKDDEEVLRRFVVKSNGGTLTVMRAGSALFSPANSPALQVLAYTGTQRVISAVPAAGGVVAQFSGGGVYFSPNGRDLGGGGLSVAAYRGAEPIAKLAAVNDGVVTLFANGKAYFSPDGRNLGGGGNTQLAYGGSQKIVGLIEVPGGVKAEFDGGGIYFSRTGMDLGGSGSSVPTPAWNVIMWAGPFGQRDSGRGASFKSNLLLSSGFYRSPDWSYNDVWLSSQVSDMNWSLVTGDAYPSRDTPSDMQAPYSALVEHDGALLAIGNTVWRSTTGRQWRLWSTTGPVRATEDVHAGVLGGRIVAVHTQRAEAYSSADGRTWTAPVAIPDFRSRCGAAVYVAAGRMWIMGGASCDYRNFYTDIWSTADGENWARAVSPATGEWAQTAWSGRMWPSACVGADGRMWAVGGYERRDDVGYNLADVWTSSNGLDWTRLVVNAVVPGILPAPRHAATCISDAAANRLIFLAGKGHYSGLNDNSSVMSDIWALELPRPQSLP